MTVFPHLQLPPMIPSRSTGLRLTTADLQMGQCVGEISIMPVSMPAPGEPHNPPGHPGALLSYCNDSPSSLMICSQQIHQAMSQSEVCFSSFE